MTAALTQPPTESKVVDRSYPKGVGMRELVRCQICGVGRRRLGSHLQAAHGLTADQYRSQFPGNPIEVAGTRRRSAECRARQAEAARRRWEDPKARKEQSKRLKVVAPWKGKNLSDEHKQAISDGGTGKPHDLTDERRQELGEQGRRVLAEIRVQPGYSAKLSSALKRRHSQSRMGFADPKVWRKAYASKVRNGTLQAPGAGRGITGFRKGISHYCRSTLEANFARILTYEGIPYEYEPKVFMLPGGGRWTPDFRLLAPLGDIPKGWVELKGWRGKDGSFPGGASEKIKAFEQMTGESVYVLVQSTDPWRALRDKYSSEVPWEKPRFNLRTHPRVFGRNS